MPGMLTVMASGFVLWRLFFGQPTPDFPLTELDGPTGILDPWGPFVLYVWVDVA